MVIIFLLRSVAMESSRAVGNFQAARLNKAKHQVYLSMQCFWCKVISGELILKGAAEARWLTKEELDSVEWLPADLAVIDKLQEEM